MKTSRVTFAILVAAAALAIIIPARHWRNASDSGSRQAESAASPDSQAATVSTARPASHPPIPLAAKRIADRTPEEAPVTGTNKLERLAQIRENFRALAAGDKATAMRAAKQITDETERETALLTLVTEWTHGELGPPGTRARWIAAHGLEAGLGLELARQPDLAMLWADELTDAAGKAAILQVTGVLLASTDPAAALALEGQLPPAEHLKYIDSLFTGWAGVDTAAAMQSAGQLSDPAERDAAMQAIWAVAPVGIGAALSMQDGYPTISQLVPGTPAELSGQLHPGDRILALAQGTSPFVDTHGLSLQDAVQMIRGAPNTVLQLQILPAGAPPDSPPQTISIVRDQIKFKQ